MLRRVTKAARIRTAAILALLYALCVLAPAVAFAFSDGSHVLHCLIDDHHGLGIVHADEHPGMAAHVHGDGTAHEHSKAPQSHGKNSLPQCCGLAFTSALPATLTEVPVPVRPAAREVHDNQQDLAGRAPDRLYRPPISHLAL